MCTRGLFLLPVDGATTIFENRSDQGYDWEGPQQILPQLDITLLLDGLPRDDEITPQNPVILELTFA